MAFVEDNILRKDSGITHGGVPVVEYEELSPTIENFIVLTWLRLIHSELPKLTITHSDVYKARDIPSPQLITG